MDKKTKPSQQEPVGLSPSSKVLVPKSKNEYQKDGVIHHEDTGKAGMSSRNFVFLSPSSEALSINQLKQTGPHAEFTRHDQPNCKQAFEETIFIDWHCFVPPTRLAYPFISIR